jgi:hypothetical protein
MQSPNASHAPAAPIDDDPSRRRFLAAGSAVTVFASLRGAIAQAEVRGRDPIFAAIERHKETEIRFCAACKLTDEVAAEEEGRVVTSADEAEYEAASAASESALAALLATPPATKAGFHAAFEYIIGLGWDECLSPFAETLRKSNFFAN